MIPCIKYASRDVDRVLRTMADPLTRKASGEVKTLINLDRDFEVEQAVYFKDIFGVRSLADDREIYKKIRQRCRNVRRVLL